MDAVESFRREIEDAGLRPREIIADGKLHRCPVEGKPGAKDGAYVLYMDGRPAGWFQNWRTGQEGKWNSGNGASFSADQLQRIAADRKRAHEKHEAEKAEEQSGAAQRAEVILEKALPCQDHPYLDRKGVKPVPASGWIRRAICWCPSWGLRAKPKACRP